MKTSNKLLESFSFSVWIYSVVFIPAFLLLYFVSSLIPGNLLIEGSGSKIPIFDSLIIFIILLPTIGGLVSVISQNLSPVAFWNLKRDKLLLNISTSFLIVYIVWITFFPSLPYLHIGFVLLLIASLLVVPQVSAFLNSVDFEKLKAFFDRKGSLESSRSQTIFILLILGWLLLIHNGVMITNSQVVNFKNRQNRLAQYSTVETIEPRIAYHGTRVILRGEKFSQKEISTPKLFNKQGEVKTDYWDEGKIIFTVPLHWSVGTTQLWITKPVTVNGKTTIARSNIVEIKVISRLDGWNSEDDEYFDQLKTLSNEALILNGHNIEEKHAR